MESLCCLRTGSVTTLNPVQYSTAIPMGGAPQTDVISFLWSVKHFLYRTQVHLPHRTVAVQLKSVETPNSKKIIISHHQLTSLRQVIG